MNKLVSATQISDKAIQSFKSGFNCSQSVLTAYSDFLDLDDDIAQSVSCGFGAGMGRLQETCGAVTGSYMVLSTYSCKKFIDNNDRKEYSYKMIQDFNGKFIEKHKTTNCRLLLNCDLMTEEGQQQVQVNKLTETVCEVCISDSINIINELIETK